MHFFPYTCGARSNRVVVAASLVLLLLGAGCEQQKAPKPASAVLEPVTVCRHSTMLLPLVVAEHQGFFPEQGLAVSVREFTMGRDAMEGLLRGECDFTTAAEPPVVEYAAQRDDLRILGSVQSSDNMVRLAARADRGIAAPHDLRGKRIATVRGTNAHYFLDVFLERNGLSSKEVAIVFMKSDALLGALVSGEVDAIAMTNKVIAQARQALQDKAVLFEAPGLARSYIMLLTTSGLLEKRPEAAERFLRAVSQAEDFIRKRPEETEAIAQASQQVSTSEIRQLLGFYQYELILDHGLLMGLEETARWSFLQAGESQRRAPNFLNLIAAEPLRALKPEAVRLEK
jgi:NitT/TauT family transport system substrate-binding protein